MKQRVIIESPFAGICPICDGIGCSGVGCDKGRNVTIANLNTLYLRACLHDSLIRGEAPFASHAIYTQQGVLCDTIPGQRALGIEAGFEWWKGAHKVVFYTDLGWSAGMLAAYGRFAVGVFDASETAEPRYIGFEIRMLGGDWSRELAALRHMYRHAKTQEA